MNNYNKVDLEQMINIDNLSYCEIGRKYGVSDGAIKKAARKLGIQLTVRAKFPVDFKPANKGMGEKRICVNCEKIVKSKNKGTRYCSMACEKENKKNKKYQHYLTHQEEYCYIKNMRFVKPHILKEQQNKCAVCDSINVWNNKTLVFILDHMNGDAANNKRNNLRLICPNCDSQLDTYKSKNKNSARKERYLRNYKN